MVRVKAGVGDAAAMLSRILAAATYRVSGSRAPVTCDNPLASFGKIDASVGRLIIARRFQRRPHISLSKSLRRSGAPVSEELSQTDYDTLICLVAGKHLDANLGKNEYAPPTTTPSQGRPNQTSSVWGPALGRLEGRAKQDRDPRLLFRKDVCGRFEIGNLFEFFPDFLREAVCGAEIFSVRAFRSFYVRLKQGPSMSIREARHAQ